MTAGDSPSTQARKTRAAFHQSLLCLRREDAGDYPKIRGEILTVSTGESRRGAESAPTSVDLSSHRITINIAIGNHMGTKSVAPEISLVKIVAIHEGARRVADGVFTLGLVTVSGQLEHFENRGSITTFCGEPIDQVTATLLAAAIVTKKVEDK
jgi:hypothetical protein